MNFAYVHLAVNHLPIVGTGIALLLLLVAFARRDDGMFRAGLLVTVLSGLGAISAFQSGQRAEEQLEEVVVLEESMVESHEEASETAQWLALAASFLSLLALVAMARPGRRHPWLRWLKVAVVAATALVLVAVLRSAQTGGRIRHPEVRGGVWQSPAGAAEQPMEKEGGS